MNTNLDDAKFFQGVVEDINDPLKLGRVRVRIFGKHTKSKNKNNERGIPTEDLFWCTVGQSTHSASVSGVGESTRLLNGSWVYGLTRDSELYQDLVVVGSLPGIPKNLPNMDDGFNDPEGKYPREDYLNESDINRLARAENIEKTIVQLKRKNEEKGVKTATGSWDEPKTPYAAIYPYNKVTESESGHITEVDDTPKHERIHEYHKSGTFREIHPDGTIVEKIIGSDYEIVLVDKKLLVKGNLAITVIGNADLRIVGDATTVVEGDETRNIKGNLTENVDGDVVRNIGGSVNESVSGVVVEKASSYTTDGAITQSGGIVSDSDIVSSTEVTAGIISLTKHKHPTAPSGPPSMPIP